MLINASAWSKGCSKSIAPKGRRRRELQKHGSCIARPLSPDSPHCTSLLYRPPSFPPGFIYYSEIFPFSSRWMILSSLSFFGHKLKFNCIKRESFFILLFTGGWFFLSLSFGHKLKFNCIQRGERGTNGAANGGWFFSTCSECPLHKTELSGTCFFLFSVRSSSSIITFDAFSNIFMLFQVELHIVLN